MGFWKDVQIVLAHLHQNHHELDGRNQGTSKMRQSNIDKVVLHSIVSDEHVNCLLTPFR